jgi:hypothetical protein
VDTGPEIDPIDWSTVDVTASERDFISAGSTGSRRAWAAALIGGVLLGAVGMHFLDARPRATVSGPESSVVDVRVSLGAMAGTMTVVAGDPVVSIPLVITNFGNQPVTLSDIGISGPGASLVADPGGRPSQMLPWTLAPGASVDTLIAVRSDCSVAVRPPPQVTVEMPLSADTSQGFGVRVPDLDRIWGQTLVAPACGLR